MPRQLENYLIPTSIDTAVFSSVESQEAKFSFIEVASITVCATIPEININGDAPIVNIRELDIPTEAGRWRISLNNAEFRIRTRTGNNAAGEEAFAIVRSTTGVTIEGLVLYKTTDVRGDITVNSIPVAYSNGALQMRVVSSVNIQNKNSQWNNPNISKDKGTIICNNDDNSPYMALSATTSGDWRSMFDPTKVISPT